MPALRHKLKSLIWRVPAVSVGMPVYNGEAYVALAVQSVLSQTFTDFELLVVNNASTDQTVSIIENFHDPRIRLINNPKNLGLIGNLNVGLRAARGKYVARLDHDDLALPTRFSEQYEFMEAHQEIDVVGSWTECIDSAGKTLKVSRSPRETMAIRYELLFNNVMFHSSIFFRTDVVRNNGGYSQEFVHAEDYEMYSRPGKELECFNLQKVLFKYRVHGASITGSSDTLQTVHMNALNVAYRNMSQYLSLTRDEFDKVKDLLVIKKPVATSFSVFLMSLKKLRELTKNFIKKNNLSVEDKRSVLEGYRGRRKMVWQHYLIGTYRRLFKHS